MGQKKQSWSTLMIRDLLPNYYAAHGMNPAYETVRSIMIDGHEVAWMEYKGAVTYDITGQGRKGQPFVGRGLYCECHFAENVGWKKDEKYGVVGLMGQDRCVHRKAAVHLRHLELRNEYMIRFAPGSFDPASLYKYSREIVLDLIERAKAREFIGETGEGTSLYGGYFYLQTMDAIMGRYFDSRVIRSLLYAKVIGMNGAIVTPYREPLPPRWEQCLTITDGPFAGVAYLPVHADMPQTWLLKVFVDERPVGGKEPHEVPLMHSCEFGADFDDIAQAKEHLKKLIVDAKLQVQIEKKCEE